MTTHVRLYDFHPDPGNLLEEVEAGLNKTNKELPCKLFYDERGSELFNQICELPEYYPTRTETGIMTMFADEMSRAAGPRCLLVEYGSGNSNKTRVLLDHLQDPVAYVPIDISREHLMESAGQISRAYPHLEVLSVCADYEQSFDIPKHMRTEDSRLVYFPGSTIGNFRPLEVKRFLDRVARVCGAGGRLLIGVDLKKDPAILTRAYNDSGGVTAEFNLNILRRINRELGANFNLRQFRHHAYYNKSAGRIEMHLVSTTSQQVQVNGSRWDFVEGETIWTESSYKYSIEEFEALARRSGFEREAVWTDKFPLFSVQLFRVGGAVK
jgi:dimethylhistidine N-methyltransferase